MRGRIDEEKMNRRNRGRGSYVCKARASNVEAGSWKPGQQRYVLVRHCIEHMTMNARHIPATVLRSWSHGTLKQAILAHAGSHDWLLLLNTLVLFTFVLSPSTASISVLLCVRRLMTRLGKVGWRGSSAVRHLFRARSSLTPCCNPVSALFE